jgi:DNA-binding phage protein
MTPEQALQLLDKAAGMANVNRDAHLQIQQAYQVLLKAIQPKEKKDVPKGKVPTGK